MKLFFGCLVLLVQLLSEVHNYVVEPGPTVIATKGEVWPKPKNQNKSDSYFVIHPARFQFKLQSSKKCKTLTNAFIRYELIIRLHQKLVIENRRWNKVVNHKKTWIKDQNSLGYLESLNVYLNGDCNDEEYPNKNMNEEYTLQIKEKSNNLKSNSIWGILRGLETFSQSIYLAQDGLSLRTNLTSIEDSPRFGFRGLLLDTSRHYIPMKKILTTLDAMAYNKLNVFHWHIVDDQSFPYVSQKFPELSSEGAYRPNYIYSAADIQLVIEYARERGIRVIPEFDTPGHTRSWGVAHPELLTECYENNKKNGEYGPLDVSKTTTYEFINKLFSEVAEVFVDEYIHLGGDEVEFDCWDSNPDIQNFMKKQNISDSKELESFYIQKLLNMVDTLNSSSIVWEEVFSNGVKLPNQTVVHVWKTGWELVMDNVTKSGRNALLSACWYLDHLESGGDWKNFYNCEPYDFVGNDEQKKKILGGEACMWSESVDESNVISRVWPRASATAERLWSSEGVNDTLDAQARLEEHYCRLKRRGVDAQPPNSAGFCL